MRTQATSKRRRRERGSISIEVSFTVVLLFGLLFLVMDLAMLVFIRSTLLQAVRDGVRTGVTQRLGGSTYVNDAIIQKVQDSSLGFLRDSAGACKIQIAYYKPESGAASTGTQGDILFVSVNGFNYTPLGAILRRADPFAITVSSSDIVERCPAAGCATTQNPVPRSCP